MEFQNEVVLDIESNGLLDTITNIWCIVLRCVRTDAVKWYLLEDTSWQKFVEDNVKVLVGHNIIGYDLQAIKKIQGWSPPSGMKIHDTMIMSQALDYKRFTSGRHSLKEWGLFMGHEKSEFSEFDKYSQEMLDYCIQDTNVNRLAYLYLLKEFKDKLPKKPLLKRSLQVEHDTAMFCAEAETVGWNFDKESAIKVMATIRDRMTPIEDTINPLLKLEVKYDKEVYKPKFKKNGEYYSETCKYFNVKPEDGEDELNRPICGELYKLEFIQPDIGNMDSVKGYLTSIGWIPDDWNWEKVNGKLQKKSSKLSESSLKPLGPIGEMVNDYYTLRSRHSILEGWVNSLDANGRIHGSCFTIATPTGRARHGHVVNVPGADAEYGPEMRALFRADPGYKIVGADSSGNQMRALLYYLKNDEFTNEVLNGDVHQKNADILTEIYGQKVSRSDSKPFLYAFLFGAGTEKLGLILSGKRDAKLGKKAKEAFIAKTPGLADLISRIEKEYNRTHYEGNAYLSAVDGRPIYCDSKHKSLNYLLQSFEAISVKAAISYFMKKCKDEGLNVIPQIFMHDEIQVACPESQADRVREIAEEAMINGAKDFDINILDGKAAIGNDWYETH